MQNSIAKPHVYLGLCLFSIGLAMASSMATAQSSAAQETQAKFASDTEVYMPKGYRSWTHVGTFLTPPGSRTILDGSTIAGAQFGNTFVEPSAYAAFKATGKWPDGTQIIKEFSESGFSNECDAKSGTCSQEIESCDKSTGVCKTKHGVGVFQQHYFGAGYMVKDAKHFPDAPGNWGYFGFGPTKGTPYPATAKLRPAEQCSACHVAHVADKDYVFSDLHLGLSE